jgi:hypothetical protein
MLGAALALSACATAPMATSHATMPQQQVFATPDEAVDALVVATRADNKTQIAKILGPQSGKLIHSGDKVADQKARERFLTAYDKAHSLETESNGNEALVVGEEEWPMPIPLVQVSGGWQWDTAAGAEEILNRRIGRNELNVIEVARAYVEAQQEFAAQHSIDHKHEYAQRFVSSEGQHDGLYWPAASGEEESPLGPLIAKAEAQGYSSKEGIANLEPYHGYYYRILTRQGPHAAGGAKDYIKDGHMVHGFALIAFPARYGDSGVMSFIVNQNGIVYEKNLGPGTAKIAAGMMVYDPDSSWKVVE